MFWKKAIIPCLELSAPNSEQIFKFFEQSYCSSSSWVIEKVRFLRQKLEFSIKSENFLFEPTEEIYELLKSGKTVNLQLVVDKICKHILFEPIPQFIYDWDFDLDMGDTTIGQALYTSGSIIKVRMDFAYRFKELGAILAHEIAHHYLIGKGVELVGKNENEKLTDLCVIYLGLGKILMNGYDIRYDELKKQPSDKSIQVGYLKLDALAYAFDLICCLNIVNPDTWISNLSAEARYYIQNRAVNRMQLYSNYRQAQAKYDSAFMKYANKLFLFFDRYSKMAKDIDTQWQDFNRKLESVNQFAHKLKIAPKHGKVFVQMNNDRVNLEQKIKRVKDVFAELGHFCNESRNPNPSKDRLMVIEERLRSIYLCLEEVASILKYYCSVLKRY